MLSKMRKNSIGQILENRIKGIIFEILLRCLCCIALALPCSCSRNVSGLQVKCDEKGAEAFLDGKRIGTCPVSLTPAAGDHVLIVKKDIDADTYYFYESSITVRDGEPQKVNAKLGLRFTEEAVRKIENDFVLVKGGCFQMGDVFGDGFDDERPVHEVCLDDFSISKYETIQALWQKVMGENPSHNVSDRLPVESVSWNDTQKFITRLNSMTRMNYRLPTEAEWEYAARSGGKLEKWAGTNNERELSEYAWYSKNSENTAHFVGLKKPNGLGLYDMTGNVDEWVKDGWSNYGSASQRNPQGAEAIPGANYQCVLRGGAFLLTGAKSARVFTRGMRSMYRSDVYIGFRLAHSMKQGK